MTALAGFFRLDGAPASEVDLARLEARFAYRRPTSRSRLTVGPVGLVCVSRRDDSPIVADATLGAACAFAGWLDNRVALANELDLPPTLGAAQTVLAAYARWGVECATRLHGDFALVIWDEQLQRVFAARDVAGIKPFFHAHVGDRFMWASDVQTIAREARFTLNEGMIGEYLADRMTSITDTLFDGISRLPPAHAMVVDRTGSAKSWRHWTPPANAMVFADERDYDDRFRALFRNAVVRRLTPGAMTPLLYSAGVDSSAIAGTAAASAPGALRCFTLTAPGDPEDEGPLAVREATRLGVPIVTTPEYHASTADYEKDAAHARDIPDVPNSIYYRALLNAIVAHGGNTVLTGAGGEEWFRGHELGIADAFARGSLWRVMAMARRDARRPGGFSAPQLIKLAVWLNVPVAVKARLRRALQLSAIPDWIDPAFARRVNLDDRCRARPNLNGIDTHARRESLVCAWSGPVITLGEQQDRVLAAHGLEFRCPFHDRELIDFAMRIPEDQRRRNGVPRWIVLRALAPVLPPDIMSRALGGNADAYFRRTVLALGDAVVQRAIESCGAWVRRDRLQDIWRRCQTGHPTTIPENWAIWWAFGLHCFLHSLTHGNS